MRRRSPTLVPDMQHKYLRAALVDVVVHTEVSHSQSIRRVEFATHSLHTTPPLEGRFHGEHLPHDAQDRPTMKHADRIQLPYRLRVDHHSEHVTFVVSNVSQDKVFETGRRRCPGTGACSPSRAEPPVGKPAAPLATGPFLWHHARTMTPTDPQLAYRDEAFLDSDAARPLRILAEYLQPLHAFARERVHDTIVFFGSARLRADGPLGRYYSEARELARLVTEWSQGIASPAQRFLVCSGGGPGIMEAANRGAVDAGGRTIGLNISLPHEQRPNPYITPGLCFEFHYFFMRKLWFAHLARALVVFPGGFGTMDELFELLTLSQTRKLDRMIPVLLYGTEYWKETVSFEGFLRHGMIDAEDLKLFRFVDAPQDAFHILQKTLGIAPAEEA